MDDKNYSRNELDPNNEILSEEELTEKLKEEANMFYQMSKENKRNKYFITEKEGYLLSKIWLKKCSREATQTASSRRPRKEHPTRRLLTLTHSADVSDTACS